MTVYFEDEAGISFGFDIRQQLDKVVSFVRDYVRCPYDIEVSVTMVDRSSIREMNVRFREMDKPTDVLSFPMMEYDAPLDFEGEAFRNSISLSPDTEELILGDIVLCSQVIKEQALEYGHSEIREFCFLVVHSLLHLFGYDHIKEDERTGMEKEQKIIMERLGISR